jgi:hypothetical protein
MTTKTRTKGTKETSGMKKTNGTKGKGKEEKQILRKMRTKRKTLLGRGQKTISLGVHFPNSWNSYSSPTYNRRVY